MSAGTANINGNAQKIRARVELDYKIWVGYENEIKLDRVLCEPNFYFFKLCCSKTSEDAGGDLSILKYTKVY